MELPAKGKFEYNFNTFIAVGGAALGIGTTIIGITWAVAIFTAKLETADNTQQKWNVSHMDLHKDRQAIVDSFNARMDQRMKKTEEDVQKILLTVENHAYRVTVLEQNVISVGKTLQDLLNTVGEVRTDMRVVRTIMDQRGETPARRR